MSKLKTNRIEPRATNGTLTIGNPDSATMFEGDVNIPDYATTEWVLDIVTEEITPELAHYQKIDEKNRPDGYAGLDSNGQIPSAQIPDASDKVSKSGDTMTGTLVLDSPNRDINITAGVAGRLKYGNQDKIRWGNNVTFDTNLDMNNFNIINPGPGSDIPTNAALAAKVSKDGDTMTGDLDMSGKRVKDIPQIPLEGSDAASKYYVDESSATIDHPVEISVFPAVNSSTNLFTVKNGSNTLFNILGDGDVELKGGQIHNMGGPTYDTDAATKYYVDNVGKNMAGPVMIHSDYVGTAEVVFGVYEELSLAQAIEKGHDPATGTPKEPRDGVPYSEYALFRVMGDGKLWGFNSLKGLSEAPGANYDATNKEYVDSKLAGMLADMVEHNQLLESKIAALEDKLATL
jgi:hypothetical protein